MKKIIIANPVDAGKKITMSVCHDGSRHGFKHVASTDDGIVTTCYYDNTSDSEAYEYQQALHNLAWKWIEANTGLRPKTKSSGASFRRLYDAMVDEIDSAMN